MNRIQVKKKAKNFKATMKKLLVYIRPFYPQLIVAIILALIAGFTTVLIPFFTGNLITYFELVIRGVENPQVEVFGLFNLDLTGIIMMLVSTALITSLFNYLQTYLLIGLTQKMTYQMRVDLADKMNHLPLKFFDQYQHGEILSRFSHDVDTITSTLTQSLAEIFRSISLVVAVLIFMFILSYQMASVVTGGIVVSLITAGFFVKLSQKFFKSQAKYNGQMFAHVEESYNGQQVIKVFNHQEQSALEFEEINRNLYDAGWKSQFISSIMFPVQFFFGNLAYIGIVIIGAYGIIAGTMASGLILTFIQYTRQVNQPIQTIGQTANIFQQTAAAAERIFEVLESPSEPLEENKLLTIENFKGEVTFENVCFGYNPDNPVINGFSAQITPGQTVAIVGPTGAGKTTIVNLLMRFYEINSGRILIDGIDIKEIKKEVIRNYFGMVLQDTWIFEGTVKENIAYGSNDKTFQQLEQASKQAQTDYFIKSLPGAYEFKLNEDGLNISQGQRQLITISRAMLADKPMLILDEATSSVDTRTEILIQKAMDQLMVGRTSFVIAHRLSTIKNADLILVMKDGNIIEQGNHHQLLEKNGFYANLYNSQFEN